MRSRAEIKRDLAELKLIRKQLDAQRAEMEERVLDLAQSIEQLDKLANGGVEETKGADQVPSMPAGGVPNDAGDPPAGVQRSETISVAQLLEIVARIEQGAFGAADGYGEGSARVLHEDRVSDAGDIAVRVGLLGSGGEGSADGLGSSGRSSDEGHSVGRPALKRGHQALECDETLEPLHEIQGVMPAEEESQESITSACLDRNHWGRKIVGSGRIVAGRLLGPSGTTEVVGQLHRTEGDRDRRIRSLEGGLQDIPAYRGSIRTYGRGEVRIHTPERRPNRDNLNRTPRRLVPQRGGYVRNVQAIHSSSDDDEDTEWPTGYGDSEGSTEIIEDSDDDIVVPAVKRLRSKYVQDEADEDE